MRPLIKKYWGKIMVMERLKGVFEVKGLLGGIVGALVLLVVANKSIFYAEPGYVYHVRTILGQEHVVSDVGYQFFFFGRWNSWKRALTVQAVRGGSETLDYVEVEHSETSAALPPQNIMFLDQVDANAQATVRFTIPTDQDTFLRLAHEYRTPENLLRTALIPAFKETLQANASLMSAEEYYSGGRTEFNTEFENQMINGIYIVRREEVSQKRVGDIKGSANVAMGTDQQDYGDDSKVIFVVRKMLDDTGIPLRKSQRFIDYGVSVVEARVTQMDPNQRFVERMQLKQKASADRAIAREQRVQEEEQRLLAIARGEREVAERQAKAKVDQIQRTTEAETEKQLAITEAQKQKEQSEIEKQTAQIQLEKPVSKRKPVVPWLTQKPTRRKPCCRPITPWRRNWMRKSKSRKSGPRLSPTARCHSMYSVAVREARLLALMAKRVPSCKC